MMPSPRIAPFVFSLMVSCPTVGTAAVTSLLNRADLDSAVTTESTWDFESLQHGTQHVEVSAPDGSMTIPLALANPLPPSAVAPTTSLSGTAIYFNPQNSKAFEFMSQVYAFGISIIWSPVQNPAGVGLELFDSSGILLATVTTTVADSVVGPFTTSAGNTYEGFLGFKSDTPVSFLRINQEEGSVLFDNAAWSTVPEPSSAAFAALGMLGFFRRRRSLINPGSRAVEPPVSNTRSALGVRRTSSLPHQPHHLAANLLGKRRHGVRPAVLANPR
jgi:MYXO-CTERM domain-containing protein